LAAAFTNKTLVGADQTATVALGTQDVSGSTFDNVEISGTCDTLTAAATIRNSIVGSAGVDAFQGYVYKTGMSGNFGLAAGTTLIEDCFSHVTANENIDIDCNGAVVDLNIRGLRGTFRLTAHSNASAVSSIDMTDGEINFWIDCSDGTCKLRGIARLTDQSTGNFSTNLDLDGFMDIGDWLFLSKQGTIFIDSSNNGNDNNTGTFSSPVRTCAAARTLADALSIQKYHIRGFCYLSEDHEDWEFIGQGKGGDAFVVLNDFACDRSIFRNIAIAGDAKSTSRSDEVAGSRIQAENCQLWDPINVHGFFQNCGIVGRFRVTNTLAGEDHVFDNCYAEVEADATNVYGTVDLYPDNLGVNTIILASWDQQEAGQSFKGNGETLAVARFRMTREGAAVDASGTLSAKLYAHTGTFGSGGTPTGAALATSTNTYDPADLPITPTYDWVEFEFDNTYTLVDGTAYFICLVLTGHDGGFDNWVELRDDNRAVAHPGNRAQYNGSWSAAARDVPFYVGTRASTSGNVVLSLEDSTLDHTVLMHGFQGGLDIVNVAAGDIDIVLHGGEVDATSTATGGTIRVRGDGAVTDNSAGATVTVEAMPGTVLSDAMTEEYPGDGVSAVSPAAMLYSINQMLSEFARTGTTVSVKKRDGTEAFQLTLDSATQPTTAEQSS
jgi:hypothetical protein